MHTFNKKLDNLTEIRQNNNLKQINIANYLSYERSYYNKIENGICELKFNDALKLCLLFNCEILYIYNIKRSYKTLSNEDRILIEKYLKNFPRKF